MANKITTFFSFQEEGNGLKRIAKEVKEADGAINKLKVGVKSSIREFKSSNAAQAGAIAGLGAAAYKAIGYASDLEESVNAVTVTYGENAESVLAIGENAAKSFGMSKTEFNGFAVQFSAFAKQVAERDGREVSDVLEEMTGRVADFASVMNLDLNTASQVFMSTMAGETEPIRRFGKDVSAAAVEAYALANGLIESKSEMTEAIKVQARYGLLMEQTNDTAGDFANTSDSLANSQRILSAEAKDLAAELGTTLGPGLATIVSGLTDVLGVLDKLKVTDAISMAWVEPLGTTLGKVLSPWNKQAREANEAIVSAFNDAEQAAAEFDHTLLEGAETFEDARAIALEYAEGVEGLEDAQHAANVIALKWNETNVEAAEAQAEAEKAALAHTEAQRDQAKAADHTATVLGENNRQLDKLKGFAQRAAEYVANLGTKWDILKGKMSDRSAFLDVEDAFDGVKTAAEEAWTAAAEGSEDAERKARDYERAQIDLKNKVIDYGTEVGDLPDQVVTNILSLIDQGKLAEAEAALARLERARQVNYTPIVYAPRSPGGNPYMDSGGAGRAGNIVAEKRAEFVNGALVSGPGVMLGGSAQVTSGASTEHLLRGFLAETRSGGGGQTVVSHSVNISVSVAPGADGTQAGRQIAEALESYYRNGGRRV